MGKLGYGYGSEFHLLRYLAYHRSDLSHAIERETRGKVLDWVEFSFGSQRAFPHLDAEWKGLEFLDPDTCVRSAWAKFWPQTGNVPNWDAVGLMQSGSHVEYLLVEAKGHPSEINSNCGAKPDGGLQQIQDALSETIRANSFCADVEKWLSPYYQYANRLAHLQFLLQHNISARLIFIYFLGDRRPKIPPGNWWDDEPTPSVLGGHRPREAPENREPVICPQTVQEWDPYLKEMYGHLGLKGESKLEQRVHRVFLPVWRSYRVEDGTNGI
jgi:hypothetical protein